MNTGESNVCNDESPLTQTTVQLLGKLDSQNHGMSKKRKSQQFTALEKNPLCKIFFESRRLFLSRTHTLVKHIPSKYNA